MLKRNDISNLTIISRILTHKNGVYPKMIGLRQTHLRTVDYEYKNGNNAIVFINLLHAGADE